MSVRNQYPNIKPTANFDFANTKVLDPRITFTRSSTATYYDGKTLAKAEENLWVGSTTIGNQSLVTKTDNAATTPDGYQACLLVPTTANNWHTGGHQAQYLLAALPYRFSFVAKPSGYNFVRVGDAGLSLFALTVDLSTLAVSNTAGAWYTGATATALTDGWVRVVVSILPTSSAVPMLALTPFPSGATVDVHGRFNGAGDGTSGAFFGEFQLVQRSAFTIHQPTTIAPITNWQPALLTAPSGEPRFQHDPITGKSLGFLSERQSTNLMTWSEFGGPAIDTGGMASNVALARMFGPDGTLANAVRFGNNTVSRSLLKGTATASVSNAVSAYVKMDDGTAPVLTGSVEQRDFVLQVAGVAVDDSSIVIQHVGNGLYRVSGARTAGSTNLADNGVVKQTNNSSRGFRTTGWQLEAHSRATSYIKTEGSQVTRIADTAIIEGANLDSFYNQRGGTFVADCILSTAGTNMPLSMSFGTSATDRQNAYTSGTGLVLDNWINNVSSGGHTIANIVTNGAQHRIARRCADYNLAACVNGGTVASSTFGQIGVKNRLGIGCTTYAGNDRLNDPIARLAYYDELLTNAQMQALTRS